MAKRTQKPDENGKSRSLTSQIVCFDCAAPITANGALTCWRCGSMNLAEGHARPKAQHIRDVVSLIFPLDGIRIKRGCSLLLSGDKGSGKTTILLYQKPTVICTSEQEIEEVANTWWRIHGDDEPCPEIFAVNSWGDLWKAVQGIDGDDIVLVDSVSQLASHEESKRIVADLIIHNRERQSVLLLIAQFTKDGTMLGPNELNHAVDVVCKIPKDPSGQRRLTVEKDRAGAGFTRYFRLGAHGPLEESFEFAYTVEGSVGNYSLLLYPMSGAKFDGIFQVLVDAGVLITGMASAAVACRGYATGYAEPGDIAQRRRFAESHGLEWIDPERANELVEEAALDAEGDPNI